jgi:hypothetical protein
MHQVLLLKDFLVNAGLSSLNEKRERERELYIYISAERAIVREKKKIHFHHYKTKRNKIYKHRVIIN